MLQTPFVRPAAAELPTAEPVAPAAAVSSPNRPDSVGETPAADGELVSLRTESSRTHTATQGLQARLFPEPVNVKDDQGRWQPIDNTLVDAADGTSLQNRRGQVELSLPAAADGPTRLTSGKAWVQFGLQGAQPAVIGAITGAIIGSVAGAAVGVSYGAPAGFVEGCVTGFGVEGVRDVLGDDAANALDKALTIGGFSIGIDDVLKLL